MSGKENRLVVLFKRVMWQDYGDPDHHDPAGDNCVVCYGQRRTGHRDDCELNLLLAEIANDRKLNPKSST